MDFSIISQDPTIRAMVQENALQRSFHDALFPAMMFRAEATPVYWPAQVGDNQIFTGRGLLKPRLRPLANGEDPVPQSWKAEQWSATAKMWAETTDTSMPNSIVAISSLFYANAQQLGLVSAQTVNRLVRNEMYNKALSGHTVCNGGASSTTTIPVKSLNGLTRARNPDSANGSPVRFEAVSSNNPLAVRIMQSNGSEVTRNITGYSPDNAGDETGPGTISISGGNITVSDRGYVIASDASVIFRVGGGNSVDSIGGNDVIKLNDVRQAVARLRLMNVPPHPDGRFHCHLDPISETQLMGDPEFQRLMTATAGQNFMYREFAIGELLGCIFFRNNECPLPTSVEGGDASTPAFTLDDPYAGELWSNGTNTGTPIHSVIFTGGDACKEYYLDQTGLITEAGLNGKIGTFQGRLHNNGIEIVADRIELIIRAPLDRLQQKVATSSRVMGDFVVRTDAATGDAARYKRTVVIQHGA